MICLILRSSARSANTGTQSGNVRNTGGQFVTGSLKHARQSLTLTVPIAPTQTTLKRMYKKRECEAMLERLDALQEKLEEGSIMKLESCARQAVKVHTVYRLADGTKVPGVTTVLGVINKPQLGEVGQ